jgi:hypothetical protein
MPEIMEDGYSTQVGVDVADASGMILLIYHTDYKA